ncbi:AraC-like DNA-binding protein [Mariniflexile fucanivorans]|uniref:AraC-like DNA-binding protein n=1 Tax=Mariniflexile fucanivorans TaxID=264023 RepID=A0A4R1RCS4_9FLAO|nr:AraC family transcriptional regulator [Mariniflexile fucanivorans]TCL63596.1 AraC-like DNA-binding protein [Mariniflexile fucanivorans]
MEFRFKNSECNGGELVKIFNKDFETTSLSEEEYSDCRAGINCTIKETHVNNAFVFFQDYNNEKSSEGHTLQVIQNHPVFLLQFVIDGEVTFTSSGTVNKDFSLNKNTYNLFYIPASKYSYKYHNHQKRVLNLYFTESFLADKMDFGFIKDLKKYEQAKKKNQFYAFFNKGLVLNRQLKSILNEFLNCSFNGRTKQSYLESKLTELVLIALTSKDSEITANKLRKEEREALIKIENYIQTHLKEELSIEKLSVLAGFNTSKFKSLFKEVYGMPVFRYITSLRIEKAIRLISNHDYTITQASYEVGYKNPQHFTVAFKKKLGYLPSELINKGLYALLWLCG